MNASRHRARHRTRARGRGERGTALVEFSWLALLLMVPLVYLVLAVFEVQRAAFAVSSAARSGARAFTQAASEARAPTTAGAAVDLALADHGVEPGRASTRLTCRPEPGGCLRGGSSVTVTVTYPVALPLLPAVLGGQRPSVRVEGEHSVPYGTFRADRP